MERVCTIYARASLDRTERRISVDRQIERCRALAAERYPDLTVVVYQDNNRSASDPDVQRPGFDVRWHRYVEATWPNSSLTNSPDRLAAPSSGRRCWSPSRCPASSESRQSSKA